ncbi:MAG: hypothetical protein AAGD06_20010, partial [Acidobacteriota bacterium]
MLRRDLTPTALLRLPRRTLLAGLCLILLAAPPAMAQASDAETPAGEKPGADAPYRDANRPVDERVADLLARMTLE